LITATKKGSAKVREHCWLNHWTLPPGTVWAVFSDERPATASLPEEVWYYADAENQAGPVSLKELRGALATYSNAKELLVWCARFPEWKEAGEVPELQLVLHSGL